MIDLSSELQCGKPGCACKRGSPVHCPSVGGHRNGDANPSLTVDMAASGSTLFHCQSGCSQDDVIQALGARSLWPLNEPTDNVRPVVDASGEPDSTYRYVDADGVFVAEKGRWNDGDGKTMRWRRKLDGPWIGLGDLKLPELPLYNLSSVLTSDPTSTVYFVEGEKAVAAAHAAGLVAVTLGGGAGQTAFGDALAPLRNREVYLWPDNDDQGRQYMSRIAEHLPQAKLLNVGRLPEKGDAYDFFIDQRRTGDELDRWLERTDTYADHITGGIRVTNPLAKVTLTFSQMYVGRQELRCVLRIEPEGRESVSRRINLESDSAITGLRRNIDSYYGKGEYEWDKILLPAIERAKELWATTSRAEPLGTLEELPARRWFIEKFMPENVTTCLFGKGGTGKSYLALDIALHGLRGEPFLENPVDNAIGAVMIVDYEDEMSEWDLRLMQLCSAHGWDVPLDSIHYRKGGGLAIDQQITELSVEVEKLGIGLLIVDSAASAAGGELMGPEGASRVTSALNTLPCTVLLIAHNTKQDDEDMPFGSVFWHNLVRATHYIRSVQQDGSPFIDFGLWNRKGNRGKQPPIGGRIKFDEDTENGPVHIFRTPGLPSALFDEGDKNPIGGRIVDALRVSFDGMTNTELAEVLDEGVDTVRKTTERLRKADQIKVRDGERRGRALIHEVVPEDVG